MASSPSQTVLEFPHPPGETPPARPPSPPPSNRSDTSSDPAGSAAEAGSGVDSGGEGRASVGTLGAFRQRLRDYQRSVCAKAYDQVLTGAPARRLFVLPTGTGKGTTELALLKALSSDEVLSPDAVILTPSLEVIRGFLQRLGFTDDDLLSMSTEALHDAAQDVGIYTPVRLRNQIARGERGTPSVVIYDEAHHAVSDNKVSGLLFAIAPAATWIGFTATGYRGSSKATAQLHDDWGKPVEVMTLPQAVDAGYCSRPTFETVPLVDDDAVTTRGGEFVTSAVANVTKPAIPAMAKLLAEHCTDADSATTDMAVPTLAVVPNTECGHDLVDELLSEWGIGAYFVGQATTARARAAAYEACRARTHVLVAISVVGEGVDFPWLGCIVDAKPTLSPVAWVQLLGRALRPKPYRPRYVCTNRNLERHSYLLHGLVPAAVVAAAQDAFAKPSTRTTKYRVGLEGMGRLKQIPVPLRGGVKGFMYSIGRVDSDTGIRSEYVVILDPTSTTPIVATRSVQPRPEGAEVRPAECYGAYSILDRLPDDLTGFATTQDTRQLSTAQRRWWRQAAERYGLDPDAADRLKRRQFGALPVLKALRRHVSGRKTK